MPDKLLKNILENSMSDMTSGDMTTEEIDALGEIGNISIGTSATTLSALLNHEVHITTPTVRVTTWEDLMDEFIKPCVATQVEYTAGLSGSNIFVLKEEDAKIIADLMMGGEGVASDEPLNELHISAVSEAMNQMIGSSCSSLSLIFNRKIDISPPNTFIFDTHDYEINPKSKIAIVAFKMNVGTLINSAIMQILPIEFAKELLFNVMNKEQEQKQPETKKTAYTKPKVEKKTPISVQPADFKTFDDSDEYTANNKNNMDLVLDVPLKITVELGYSYKEIKDILSFSNNTIIELNKKAGEPVDILVNGKIIARGEIILIDESLGVKITNIEKPITKNF